MSNIDKQAVQAVADLKAGYTLGHADVAILNELARIALASLEAEPVSVFKIDHESSLIKHVKRVVSETNAPPAPVSVPDEATPENIEILASTFAPCGVTYQWDRDECNAAADSWNACRAAMLKSFGNSEQLNSPVIPDCWCRTCRPVVLNDMRFVVCPDCGNKRCPRANDHKNSCTGSNEPGQEGSAYPASPAGGER